MSLQSRLQKYRAGIEQALIVELDIFASETQALPVSSSVTQKLRQFLVKGKMVRGSIICLVYEMLSNQPVSEAVYKVAAAEEIFASALLVHDDVMDRDRVRRGELSIFAQYEQEAAKVKSIDAEHYGYSQAILLGDICFFWVQKILANAELAAEVSLRLQSILATESIRTGFGQMLDVNAAMLKPELTQAEIESISLNKTARYTFVLPFLLGATLTNADAKTITTLEELGNNMGILFQIKDDELGLFGTEAETGKPEGNDVKEGKQTFFYLLTKQRLQGEDLSRFTALYGSQLDATELEFVRKQVTDSKAFDAVQTILAEYAQKAQPLITELPITESDKQDFKEFVEFNLKRKR